MSSSNLLSKSYSSLRSIQNSSVRPLPRRTLQVLCVACTAVFIWMAVGKVDIIAEAPGKLVPKTFVKVVQPQDAGVLTEVLVAEGDTVKAGQVLAKLDPLIATSDLSSLRSEASQAELQVRRIDAELANKPFKLIHGDSPEFAAQAKAQYEARRMAYQQQVRTESEGLNKLRSDLNAATEIRNKLAKSVATYKEIATSYRNLGAQDLQSKNSVLEKEREQNEHIQDLASQEFTVAGLKSGVRQSEQRLQQITADYSKELLLERTDALLRLQKARNELAKQDHRVTALELKAPVDGVIKDIAQHSAGAVVAPGTVLLTVVPANEPLRAEVWVRNEDAGFVYPEQKVQVKVAAFPFQKYGLVSGKVLVVSPDAADLQNPSNTQALPSSYGQPPAQGLQFRALVELDQQALSLEGKTFPLRPGMQVVAEANQGQRTVLEYLLSPVQKSIREAARER